MSATHDTSQFLHLFTEIYRVFGRRIAHGEQLISPDSLAVLLHLQQSGPLTIQESAQHFSRSQSATSEMVMRLVRKELLTRLPDEQDKRKHLIWLTPKAKLLLKKETQVLSEERVQAALETLSSEQRSSLLSQLSTIIAAASNTQPLNNKHTKKTEETK